MPPAKKVPDEQKLPIKCSVTGTTVKTNPKANGTVSLPIGWKTIDGQPVSPDGLQQKWFVVCHSVTIAGVTDVDPSRGWPTNDAAKEAWQRFRSDFREESKYCRRVANAAVAMLAMEDMSPVTKKENRKGAVVEMLSPMPAGKGLYQRLRKLFPQADSQVLGTVLQKAKSKYKESRYGVHVTGDEALPTHRRSLPVPMPDATLSIQGADGRNLVVKCKLQGRTYWLRLAGGKPFQRQIDGLRIALKSGRIGEIVLREKRVADDGNPSRSTLPGTSGRNRVPTRIMVSIPCHQPKTLIERTGVMSLTTDEGCFWRVSINGSEQPSYYENQLPRWCAEVEKAIEDLPTRIQRHDFLLQGFADDTKHDRRFPRKQRPDLIGAREKAVRRYTHRINDLINKLARSIVLLCQRRKIGRVIYDDTNKGYVPHFPWFKLRSVLANKLNEFGVSVEHVGSSDESGTVEVHDSLELQAV